MVCLLHSADQDHLMNMHESPASLHQHIVVINMDTRKLWGGGSWGEACYGLSSHSALSNNKHIKFRVCWQIPNDCNDPLKQHVVPTSDVTWLCTQFWCYNLFSTTFILFLVCILYFKERKKPTKTKKPKESSGNKKGNKQIKQFKTSTLF